MDYHDFRRSVGLNDGTIWFVNFYSPQCGHCHELAPTWRRLARLLNGVVRVGAVNCQDDFHLCRQQNIRSYPSLILYGAGGASALRFQVRKSKKIPKWHFCTVQFVLLSQGAKEEEELLQFVVENLPDQIVRLRTANFDQEVYHRKERRGRPWVVLFCRQQDDFRCPARQERHLLSNLLNGLVNFGVMDCDANKRLCKEQAGEDNTGAYYFETAEVINHFDLLVIGDLLFKISFF